MADTLERLQAALAGKYHLERELGAGGMATVYLAEDLKHHRKVALKVLRADLAASLGPERFLREITVAAHHFPVGLAQRLRLPAVENTKPFPITSTHPGGSRSLPIR